MLLGPNTIPKEQVSMENYFHKQVEKVLDDLTTRYHRPIFIYILIWA